MSPLPPITTIFMIASFRSTEAFQVFGWESLLFKYALAAAKSIVSRAVLSNTRKAIAVSAGLFLACGIISASVALAFTHRLAPEGSSQNHDAGTTL
jgi:hypothetical protein